MKADSSKRSSGKATARMVVDIAMSVAFLVLMGRVYMSGIVHEATGTVLLVLLVVHNVLNASFWKGLPRGKYSALRVYYLVIDLLLLVSMLATIVTGVLMSSDLYQPLALKSGLMKVRAFHSMLFYIDLMLLGLHIGAHVRTLAKMFGKQGTGATNSAGVAAARVLAAVLCVLGVISAWQVDLISFVTLQNAFSYIDAGKPVPLFYAQHISVMLLFAVLGHYLRALFVSRK